jgi:hypothetical protein
VHFGYPFPSRQPALDALLACTFGVFGLMAHLQSARTTVHLTLSGLRLQRRLFYRILKVASSVSLALRCLEVESSNSLHISKRLCLQMSAISA